MYTNVNIIKGHGLRLATAEYSKAAFIRQEV